MPVLLPTPINIHPTEFPYETALSTNNVWKFCYLNTIPKDAAALIVRAGSPDTTLYARQILLEYYGESESWLDQYWNQYITLDNYDSQTYLVGYRGPGSLVYRAQRENPSYVDSLVVTGYFTHSEFVNFSTRIDFSTGTGGFATDFNIASEPWYHPDATAYLAGLQYGAWAAPKGWKSRSSGGMDYQPSVFWPDENNEIWANVQSAFLHIPGYFTGQINKGTYPGGRKSFACDLKPLADGDEGLSQLHTIDGNKSFAIAAYESRDTLAITRPDAITHMRSGGGMYINGNAMICYGGRHDKDLFVLPDNQQYPGDFYLRFRDHLQYNQDAYIELCSWPITAGKTDAGTFQMDALEVIGPDLEQTISTTMAVPVVYRTVSGDYTWNGSFIAYLSGGSSNADPALSLGGVKSVTAMGSNLFGDITNRMAQLGVEQYRCVFLKNVSGTETAYGLIVWIENQATFGNEIAIGIDPAGVGESVQTIATDEAAPLSVSFVQPSGEQNGLPIGVVGPGESVAIWIRRTGDIQNPFSGAETITLAFSVANNG